MRPRPPQVEITAHPVNIQWDEFKDEMIIHKGNQALSLDPQQARWLAKSIEYLLGE